jgi:glycosyltransferase involved in cell wall biosynthesis
MKFVLLCKRRYTNKDLISDRFGRLFHLPAQLVNSGYKGLVIAADLHNKKREMVELDCLHFYSFPLSILRVFEFVSSCHEVLDKFKPDILIASGDSYLGFIGTKICNKMGIPFIFDVYDDYTVFGTNKIPGMKSLFYAAVKNADLVIISSKPLRKKLQIFNKNILIIENGFDPQLFKPVPKAEVRHKLNIPMTDTVIGYFGSLSINLGIGVLLKAFELLSREYFKARLLLAGHKKSNLRFEISGVDYRGFLPQQDIPLLINACDVVVIPYLPSNQVQQSNACKIAEYIACGIPIVATNVSNHKEIFADAPQSLCEPGSPESMASAIQTQLKSPQLIRNSGSLAWNNLAGTLSEAIKNIIDKTNK